MNQDPITVMVKRAALLILSTAQRERATEVVIGPSTDGKTSIRYRIDAAWHDWNTAGIEWSHMLSELEGLANLRNKPYPKEGIIYLAYSGVRLRWEINLVNQDTACFLHNLGAEMA